MKRFNITVNGHTYDVLVEETGSTEGVAAGQAAPAAVPAPPTVAAVPAAPAQEEAPAESLAVDVAGQDTEPLNAPMPGTIINVMVNAGDRVCLLYTSRCV